MYNFVTFSRHSLRMHAILTCRTLEIMAGETVFRRQISQNTLLTKGVFVVRILLSYSVIEAGLYSLLIFRSYTLYVKERVSSLENLKKIP